NIARAFALSSFNAATAFSSIALASCSEPNLASSAANDDEEERTRVAAKPMAIERWRIMWVLLELALRIAPGRRLSIPRDSRVSGFVCLAMGRLASSLG